MGNVWVAADQHFNHGNVIKYVDRLFSDVEHMNEFMIDAWNSVVVNRYCYC